LPLELKTNSYILYRVRGEIGLIFWVDISFTLAVADAIGVE